MLLVEIAKLPASWRTRGPHPCSFSAESFFFRGEAVIMESTAIVAHAPDDVGCLS